MKWYMGIQMNTHKIIFWLKGSDHFAFNLKYKCIYSFQNTLIFCSVLSLNWLLLWILVLDKAIRVVTSIYFAAIDLAFVLEFFLRHYYVIKVDPRYLVRADCSWFSTWLLYASTTQHGTSNWPLQHHVLLSEGLHWLVTYCSFLVVLTVRAWPPWG